MARGDMEQFQVASKLLQDLKHSPIMGFLKDQWCLQVDDMSWAPVKTKMTLERSYQCAVGLSRSLSSRIIINHSNHCTGTLVYQCVHVWSSEYMTWLYQPDITRVQIENTLYHHSNTHSHQTVVHSFLSFMSDIYVCYVDQPIPTWFLVSIIWHVWDHLDVTRCLWWENFWCSSFVSQGR